MDNNKVAYIQQQEGNWLNDNCFAAAYGFGRMGYTIQPFELANAHEQRMSHRRHTIRIKGLLTDLLHRVPPQ